MKTKSVFLSVLTATLFAFPALAADATPLAAPPPSPGPRGPMHEQILKRFDQDGDGKLSDSERAAAKKAAAERHAHMKENRQEVLARFDKNADGKLDEGERQALREAWQKFLQQQPVAAKSAN